MSENYSVCMAIQSEINVKKTKHSSIAILGAEERILLTKHERCICTRKRPVAFLIFHPFFYFLFLRTHLTFHRKKKHTRIVCQPARQVTETMNEIRVKNGDIKNADMDVQILQFF